MTLEAVSPPYSRLEKAEAILNGFDNVNINIKSVGPQQELLVFSDFWKTYEVSPQNLSTIRKVPMISCTYLNTK